MKRIFITALVTLAVGGAGLWGYVLWKTRSAPHIAAVGGRALSIRLPAEGPHYMQNDPRWSAEKIGSTTESIRNVGCTLCSVTSAAKFLGETLDPLQVNRALSAAGGYTDQGWLVWPAISKVFDRRIEAVISDRPTHEAMDKALENGQYPVIKFILPVGIPHWLVVVGKEGQDYLVHDPLVSAPEPVRLSSRTSAIYAVRTIRRRG